jgi:hypothetical protein
VVGQLVVMVLFVVLCIFAVKRFHAEPVRGAVAFGLARNSDIMDPPLGILVPRTRIKCCRRRHSQGNPLGRDSLRYDLSAPPPASQVFATGVASARQTML